MEIIAKIINVGALNERQYTNSQTGQQETFKTIGMEVQYGIDVFYVEATQETAERFSKEHTESDLQNKPIFLRIFSVVRSYTDKSGTERKSTELRLNDWKLQ